MITSNTNKHTLKITPAQYEAALERYAAAGLKGLEIVKAIEADLEGGLNNTGNNKTVARFGIATPLLRSFKPPNWNAIVSRVKEKLPGFITTIERQASAPYSLQSYFFEMKKAA